MAQESCYQSQNYKIWKQFTTGNQRESSYRRLLSITKLQNLKAIHNTIRRKQPWSLVVINHKTTKFESNSQPKSSLHPKLCVVINHKTTKFESNSQRDYASKEAGICCYQSQNYKIWKQFTTTLIRIKYRLRLLSITKLQNLKAIHNSWNKVTTNKCVVINHKTTKFESNSQLKWRWASDIISCYQSQNYKIWKQFTTNGGLFLIFPPLLSITKLQNLKAIHN